MVRSEGLEPSRLAAQDPKSCVSAISPAARMSFSPAGEGADNIS